MAERTNERRYSPVYPSVSLLCFPMSQSIFIPSQCSPDDLRRCSLLIPSASSLWSQHKPHIYLMKPAACLPTWTSAGHSVCVCVCVPCVHCTHPCAYVSVSVLFDTGAVKWASVKCHRWRIQCPGCRGDLQGRRTGFFCFFYFTCTLLSNSQNKIQPPPHRGSSCLTVWFSICVSLPGFNHTHAAVIFSLCCYFVLYLGFKHLCSTGSALRGSHSWRWLVLHCSLVGTRAVWISKIDTPVVRANPSIGLISSEFGTNLWTHLVGKNDNR